MRTFAVIAAGSAQLLGCALFFSQPMDQCSPAPCLGGYLFLAATLMYLRDSGCWLRYFPIHPLWLAIIEVLAAVFFAELGTVVIWCNIERFLYDLTYTIFNVIGIQGDNVYWLSGLMTSLVAGVTLLYFIEDDDQAFLMGISKDLWKQVKKSYRALRSSIRKGWAKRSCNARARRCGRRYRSSESSFDDYY